MRGLQQAAGSRTATAYGSQLATSLAGRGWSVISARHSGRLRGEGDQPGELDSSTIPRAFGRCSMSLIGWPRIPSRRVVPVRIARPAGAASRRLISPPTPIPWHQCRTGDIRSKSPRDYGDPVKVGLAAPVAGEPAGDARPTAPRGSGRPLSYRVAPPLLSIPCSNQLYGARWHRRL